MIRSLWTARTGLDAQQTHLDVISNNLANVSTTGFKRNRAEFQDLMYQNQRQVGGQTSENTQLPTGLHLGLGVNVGSVTRDFTTGGLQKTDNNFDLAINGGGFFQIQLPDGTTAYTRDGSFKPDAATNQLVTSSGHAVLGPVNVPRNTATMNVGANGNVQFFDKGGDSIGIGKIDLAMFINPAGLQPIGDNLFRQSEASGEPQIGDLSTGGSFGEIKQAFLETSNVNVVTELVSMIQAQRAYEMNSKAIQTSDQMLAKLSQL